MMLYVCWFTKFTSYIYLATFESIFSPGQASPTQATSPSPPLRASQTPDPGAAGGEAVVAIFVRRQCGVKPKKNPLEV